MSGIRPAKLDLAAIKRALPADAFHPRPAKLGYAAVQIAGLGACWAVMRATSHPPLLLALSVVAGHCVFCLALFGHELSHGAVLRRGPLRAVLERIVWSPSIISTAMWTAVHNRTHHAEANTQDDPDRRFSVSETGWAARVYSRLFYPGRGASLPHPFVLLHFIPYVLKQTIGVLAPSARLSLLTARARLSGRERLTVLIDLAVIVAMQRGVFVLMGRTWSAYLLGGVLPVLWASCFVMVYVFTNHFLNPLQPRFDPILGTTSVAVRRFWDRLHLNFSYHTEHHVFPAMDSRHAPFLSVLLARHFPGTYQRIPIGEAWRRLWRVSMFCGDHSVNCEVPMNGGR